ncbi:signal peptidase complex-like protein DTM1 [Typha angustifolia]|uniref:signal peptidase complex-like protein DTM1 n=1 Tax=Typha angustifolia TaxID=59011 RepID=UPI003C2F12EE
MGRNAALQSSLVGLAVVMALVGLWTMSFKKMIATYAFGVGGIAGIFLPDWEFFDRDFSQWFTPMPAAGRTDWESETLRFKFSPLRVAGLTTIYSFCLYKWWMYISS